MSSKLSALIQRTVESCGYTLRKKEYDPEHWDMNTPDDAEFRELLGICSQFTLTGVERMYALYQAVKYLELHQIPGSIVECGVWRGGSMMLAALTLLRCGNRSRRLYLYDTFQGMTEPTEEDRDYGGKPALRTISEEGLSSFSDKVAASLDDVTANIRSTGYPIDQISFVQGDVLKTLEQIVPEQVALLRLDTDWYASTRKELEVLYPRLVRAGVLIIDDYGHWAGARQATQEYLNTAKPRLLLQRIDFTGRMAVKLD